MRAVCRLLRGETIIKARALMHCTHGSDFKNVCFNALTSFYELNRCKHVWYADAYIKHKCFQ